MSHIPKFRGENHKCDNLLKNTIFFGKGKARPRRAYEGPEEEYRYSCTLSLTSTLDGGVWSTPHTDRFTPQEGSDTGLCGPQERSRQVRKISPSRGFDPRTVQDVAIRYTD